MRALVEYVENAYCINLDSRKDRWQEVSERFEELGIKDHVTRVSAVLDDDPRRGCRESHVNIVREAIAHGYENVLVFEDDVLFIEENTPDFSEVMRFLRNDRTWELFYLGGSPVYPASRRRGSIFKCRFYHTHAYIINERAYRKVLNSGLPIDVWLSLNTLSYGLFPLYAAQGPSVSDIQKRELTHLEASMLNRYDKLVRPNVVMRWWNYVRMHYINRYFRT